MSSKRRENEKVRYASAGADDAYLRPKARGNYAPRQVAVCTQEKDTWLAWIHYSNGDDALVVTKKSPGANGALTYLSSGRHRSYSKPAFLKKRQGAPDLFCAEKSRNKVSIRRYAIRKGSWKRKEKIPTRCKAIYYLDAISTLNGEIIVAYCGVANNLPGVQMFSRTLKANRWSREERHKFKAGSVNRAKLAVDREGRVAVAADVYRKNKFDIIWKILNAGGMKQWRRISRLSGWNLFPSIVSDAGGNLWVSWLRQFPVGRGDVLGLHHEARLAHLVSGRWTPVNDKGGKAPACLNLGLLPIKRYFGYAGLRRYPRLMATTDGAIRLLWEQQKDEKEIWENVDNGFLCSRKYDGKRWSRPVALTDKGVCHTFDEKTIYRPDSFRFVYKGGHLASGNDFRAVEADLRTAAPCRRGRSQLWSGWKPETLRSFKRKKRISSRPSLAGRYSLYWGDLHCHSFFSPDAEGEPDELYFFARDVAGLDFACIIDNDFYPSKALLNSEASCAADLAKNLSRAGKFIALSGYEWTFHRGDPQRSFNHRTVIFTQDTHKVIRRIEKEGASEGSFKKNIASHRYLVFPHHADWKLFGLSGECDVEITSGWGTYILDADTIHSALLKGRSFGFVGASDSHRFMPGLSGALTGIYAKELTKSAIIEALRKRRCFATAGNRTAVAFMVNDCFMGGKCRSKRPPVIRWQIIPHGELEKVEIIRNASVIYRTTSKTGQWRDESARDGHFWYYVRVKEKGPHKRYPHNIAPARGKWAWSSPVWVKVNP